MSTENSEIVSSDFEALKSKIDGQFPAGRFVAIEGDCVLADADSHQDLVQKLTVMGKNPARTLVVQAGVDYPTSAVILASAIGHNTDE